jgi:hypothetical protein
MFGWMMPSGDTTLAVDEQLKIVWRMTGDGDLRATLTDPTGGDHPLDWGPEPHTGSNYDRPGREWGVGFTMDRPGCWQLTLATDTSEGSVWLEVPHS